MRFAEYLLRRLPITRLLYSDLDAAYATIAELSDPEMKDLRLANGGINIVIAGQVVERLALAMTGWFRESGAENYVELNLNSREDPWDRYVVTVQKVGRKSPHQFRLDAEAEVDRLKGALAVALARDEHAMREDAVAAEARSAASPSARGGAPDPLPPIPQSQTESAA